MIFKKKNLLIFLAVQLLSINHVHSSSLVSEEELEIVTTTLQKVEAFLTQKESLPPVVEKALKTHENESDQHMLRRICYAFSDVYQTIISTPGMVDHVQAFQEHHRNSNLEKKPLFLLKNASLSPVEVADNIIYPKLIPLKAIGNMGLACLVFPTDEFVTYDIPFLAKQSPFMISFKDESHCAAVKVTPSQANKVRVDLYDGWIENFSPKGDQMSYFAASVQEQFINAFPDVEIIFTSHSYDHQSLFSFGDCGLYAAAYCSFLEKDANMDALNSQQVKSEVQNIKSKLRSHPDNIEYFTAYDAISNFVINSDFLVRLASAIKEGKEEI